MKVRTVNAHGRQQQSASAEVIDGAMIQFAVEQQRRFDASTTSQERKNRGHFGTPQGIAQFMAEMFSANGSAAVRVLDPGAGVGTLTAAVCEKALIQSAPRSLYFELYENDPKLIPLLERTISYCKGRLASAGHELNFVIRVEDFILANAQSPLFATNTVASFHRAILNPPYFKLRKDSPHAQVMDHVVHGQPNIYALFMAISADLLLPGGEMVAITPRSYFNGPYFRRFRKWFFDRLTARHIHIFESRTEAFKEDAVLQENVILLAEKHGTPKDVVVTTSFGRDLGQVQKDAVAYEKIIDNGNGDHVVRISTKRLDRDVIEAMDHFPQCFRDLGLEISTGPVVTFRSTEFLRFERDNDTAPLLWMHNVRPFVTRFPPKNGKPTHIVVSEASKKLLVPAKTYVLLKRFTAKEEKRRIVAGIMNPNDSYAQWVGLENHLNYVYRRTLEFSKNQAFGLAAFFNSALVDRWFRTISGNTQVNATEIRAMPVPDERMLSEIGGEVQSLATRNAGAIESIVGHAVCLPRQLIEQLVEVANE